MNTADSAVQTIDVTQAVISDEIINRINKKTARQAIRMTDRLQALTTRWNTHILDILLLFSPSVEWVEITGDTLTGLTRGVYLFRIKANGTQLASFYTGFIIDEHTCVAQEGWKSDGNYHWKECECGTELEKAAHSGGKATCIASAVCEVCGQPYGSVDSTNHTGSEAWTTTETSHTKVWSCCRSCYRGAGRTHMGKQGHAPYADTPVSTPAALLRVPSLRSAKDVEPSTETMTKQTTIRQTNGRRKTENTIISASTAAAHIWTKQIAPGNSPPVQNRRPVMSAATHTAMPSVTISAVTLTPTTKTVTGISATADGCNETDTPQSHSFTTYSTNNDATCTDDGTETAKCDYCEATDTRTDAGSATGHDWDEPVWELVAGQRNLHGDIYLPE